MSSSNLQHLLDEVLSTPERRVSGAASREQGGVYSGDGANELNFMAAVEDYLVGPTASVTLEERTRAELSNVVDVSSLVMPDNVATGTSKPDKTRIYKSLFVNTKGVVDLGPLPSSNRNSSTGGSTQDLLSARTSSSITPSVAFVDGNWSSTKFGVFVLPTSIDEFNIVCRKKIGFGTTMCIKKHCTISHRGGDFLASVRQGQVFVLKNPEQVFLEPKTHSYNISEEVLQKWLSSKRRIEDWSTDFSIANLAEHHEVLSTDDLKQAVSFTDHAIIHRSPGLLSVSRFEKSENTFMNLFSSLGSPRIRTIFPFPHKKRSSSDAELLEDETKESKRKLSDDLSVNSESVNSTTAREAFDHIYKLLAFLAEALDEKDSAFNEEIKILFSRVEMFHTDVGSRSTTRTDSLQIPTIWGSIASIAGAVDEMKKELDLVPSTDGMKRYLVSEFERIEIGARETAHLFILDLEGRVATVLDKKDEMLKEKERDIKRLSNSIASFSSSLSGLNNVVSTNQQDNESFIMQLAKGASVLKKEMAGIRLDLRSARLGVSPAASSSGNCSNYVPLLTYDAKMALLDEGFKILNEKLSKLITESESETIKSFGLGLKDREASEVWLDDNLATSPFGMIVDAHLVFEHLFHLSSDNEGVSISLFHSIKRLNLSNMTESLCLTSFEARVPKILSKSSNMAPIVKSKATTHFDRIASYAVWDGNVSGTRRILKDQLRMFEVGHTQLIYAKTKEDTRGRRVALQALQVSCTWIQDFIIFIDDTYKECIQQSSFNPDRAWELTTQLGRRIFIEVAAPRGGINTAIDIGEHHQNNKLVFWPLLRCHDIMKAYKDANFTDHPTIAAEYLKFLTANSGSDAVGDLNSKLKLMQEEVIKVKKDADKAMNLVDEMKKKMYDYEKRLTLNEKELKKR